MNACEFDSWYCGTASLPSRRCGDPRPAGLCGVAANTRLLFQGESPATNWTTLEIPRLHAFVYPAAFTN